MKNCIKLINKLKKIEKWNYFKQRKNLNCFNYQNRKKYFTKRILSRYEDVLRYKMSYPCIEIVCEKCGSTLNRMINLKSIKDSIRPFSGRCNKCGVSMNPSDFTLKATKQ